jgi:hypothetical protein
MDRMTQYLTKEHTLIGLSIARIFFGLALLYELVINLPIRFELWGNNGFIPFDSYRETMIDRGVYTLFDISSADWLVNVIVFGGILVCLLYIAGFQTRMMGILMFLLMFSIYMRNLEITHGGDNILRLLFLYLIFANVGAYFSVDAWLKKRRMAQGKPPSIFAQSRTLNDMKAVIHNFAWIACVIQLVFMYFSSGTYKIMGDMWQNGTALYYASRVQEFYNPMFSKWLWHFEPVVVFLSYSTLILQVSFAFLLLNRFTKYLAIFSACLLHIGIAFFMGLYDFSWIMIGCEMMLLTDKDYHKLAAFYRRWRKKPQVQSTSQVA